MAMRWRSLRRDDDGQDMVEYVLLMGLASLAATTAVQLAGVSILGLWTKLAAYIAGIFV